MKKSNVQIVVLSEKDLPHHVQKQSLTDSQRADYARLEAIARTGGVWMDASCFVFNRSWLEEAEALPQSVEIVGFATPFDSELLESWAFAAPQNSPFVLQWFQEFSRAVDEGVQSYSDRVRQQLPISLHERLPYLTIHATAALVSSQRPSGAMHLLPCTPYAIQSLMEWNEASTAWYFITQPAVVVQRRYPGTNTNAVS